MSYCTRCSLKSRALQMSNVAYSVYFTFESASSTSLPFEIIFFANPVAALALLASYASSFFILAIAISTSIGLAFELITCSASSSLVLSTFICCSSPCLCSCCYSSSVDTAIFLLSLSLGTLMVTCTLTSAISFFYSASTIATSTLDGPTMAFN